MEQEFFDRFCSGCSEYKNHICTNNSATSGYCIQRRSPSDINAIQIETIMLCKAETYQQFNGSDIPDKCKECLVRKRCQIQENNDDDPFKDKIAILQSEVHDTQESPVDISNIPECEMSRITSAGIYYCPRSDTFDVILQLDCGRFQFTTNGKYMPTPPGGWQYNSNKENGHESNS